MAKEAQQKSNRGGIDFLSLSKGTERNYTTGFLVNLDFDLLSLIGYFFQFQKSILKYCYIKYL